MTNRRHSTAWRAFWKALRRWSSAMRCRYIGEDGPDDNPVSTTFYGVSGGDSVRIERDRPLTDSADGRNPVNTLADLGDVIR